MQTKPQMKVYTKFCLSCIIPETWKEFWIAAANRGYAIDVIRTDYSPEQHKIASSLWGWPGYIAFAFDGENVWSLEDFIHASTMKKTIEVKAVEEVTKVKVKSKPVKRTKKAKIETKAKAQVMPEEVASE